MSDQLFRFTVLRTPDVTAATPVTVSRTDDARGGQAMVPVVAAARTLVVAAAGAVTGAELRDRLAAADDLHWSADDAHAGAGYFSGLVVSALDATIAEPSAARRQALADLVVERKVAAFLAEPPDATTFAEWEAAHPLVLPAASVVRPPRAGLVREPAVADHFVVRQELIGYRPGEIEDIKNYLRGESLSHRLRHLTVDQTETVEETEKETDRVTEAATQQRSTLSTAAQETAQSTLGMQAGVDTSGTYGPVTVSTDLTLSASSSSSQARQTANEFSSDVTRRSVETVRERELRRVTTLQRSEIEENQDHTVDNTLGADNLIGIYSWVDSVWKATTWAIGKRLMLEFLLPEPGRAIRRAGAGRPAGLPPEPVRPPDDLFFLLDDALASFWGSRYGAEGLRAQPAPDLTVGLPLQSKDFVNGADDSHVIGVTSGDLKIPDGYLGTAITVRLTSMGAIGADESNIRVDFPGVSSGVEASRLPGEGANPDIKTAVFTAKDLALGPGASVPVAVFGEDLRGFTGFVTVDCVVQDSTIAAWRLECVEKITSAYSARHAEWEARKLAATLVDPAPIPPTDPAVLCRHGAIEGLLGAWPAAAGRNDADGWPVPGALANAVGETIEFLEQALEWNNLQYVAYPYYWADSASWPALLSVKNADPRVQEFLRSGAVRVVVPARLDMTEAMLFYLDTGIPWMAASAPIPGQPGYLDIATEIQDSRAKAGEGGEQIGEFEFTLPTSLVVLSKSGELPAPPVS